MDLLEHFVDVGGPGFLLCLDLLLGLDIGRGDSLAAGLHRSRFLPDLGLDILSFSCARRGGLLRWGRNSLAGQRWHGSRFGRGLSRCFSRHDFDRNICGRCVVKTKRIRNERVRRRRRLVRGWGRKEDGLLWDSSKRETLS